MISFRYHLVSVIAVFLALALGIVVGTTGLNGEILKGLKSEVSSLRTETGTLKAQNQTLQKEADSADQYAGEYEKQVLAGTLTGHTVAVIGSPGVAKATRAGVEGAIAAAGGKITARLDLAAAYLDPREGPVISNLATSPARPATLVLPDTLDPAVLGGALLAYVLSGRGASTDLTTVVEAFVKAQMITVIGTADPKGAQLAVVLTAGTVAVGDGKAKAMPAVVSEFNRIGLRTAVAGDALSATGAGLLAVVRDDSTLKGQVSTIDNADAPLGQVSTALALVGLLAGKAGQYGTGAGVDRLFPAAGK